MSKEVLEVDPEVLVQHPHVLSVVHRIGEEIFRRKSHPYYAYRADDHEDRPQLAFHKSQKRIRLVFGGNQSGKSRAVAQELAWWLCEDHPHQKTPKAPKVYLLSNTMRTIQEGVYRHLQLILPEWMVEDEGPMVPGYLMPSFIRMKNGSHLDFLSGDGREDARRRLQSAAIDLAVIDEEVDMGIWRELQVRRLSKSGRVVVAATLVRSEPWCLDLEDQAESGSQLVDLFRFSTYRARDCGHVSAEVVAEIEGTSTPEEIAVRLAGKSRRSEGLVFPGFTNKHVIPPFPIPDNWTRYCALDPGWHNFAVIWIAVSPEEKYVIYREIYAHSQHLHVVADRIHAAEGYDSIEIDDPKSPTGKRKVWRENEHTERMRVRWIDPSAFGFHETGEKRVGTLLGETPYNLPCAPARNDVESGIEMMARSMLPGYDGVPQLRVFDTCKDFIKEMRSYRRAQDSNNSNMNAKKDAPVKRNDHGIDCFVAGTMVETDRGPREIEDVRTGDLVLTRSGYFPVYSSWKTGKRDLWEVRFSNGTHLVGTETHPFWSEDRSQWISLADLRIGESVSTIPKSLSTTGSSSEDTQIHRTGRIGCTTRHTRRTDFEELVGSTRKFGSSTSVRSRRDSSSTTRTEILQTTSSGTSNWSRAETTLLSTTRGSAARENEQTSIGFDPWPPYGTAPMKATSGTKSTPGTFGSRLSTARTSARYAGRCSNLAARSSLGSAGTTASRRTSEEPTQTTTRVSTVRPLGERGQVYNLQVTGNPEYYANGILVHNCVRYSFLGVLRYVPPMDPAFKRCKPGEFEPPVRYSKSIETLMRNEWDRMKNQQLGKKQLPPHVGGIGTEY